MITGNHSPLSIVHYPLLSALLLALLAPAASAEPDYDLEQAFSDALAYDPRLRAAEARVSEASEELQKALGQRRPHLRFRGGYGYSYDKSQARFINTYEGESSRLGVEANQSLWSFGRFPARRREAEAQIAFAEAAVEDTRGVIFGEVAQAFAEYLRRGQILEKRRDFEAHAGAWEQAVQERVDAGQSTRVELQNIRIRLYQARADRARAQAETRATRSRLVSLTGAGDWTALDGASLSALWAALPADLEEALAQAVAQAPKVAMAHSRLQSAEAGFDAAKAELRPDLGLELHWNTSRTDDLDSDSNAALLNFNVPLYEGGALRANRRQAGHAVTVAKNELRSAEDELKREVQLRWQQLNGLKEAQRELDFAIANAEEMSELVAQRLASGRATLVNQLEADQNLVNAQISLIENAVLIDKARISLLRELHLLAP